jgi:trk system potassium uptake protein TrkA
VNNPKNEPLFHMLGVTETVAGTQIIYRLIEQEVETGEQLFLTALRRGRIMIVSADLTSDSPAAGRQVRSINLPEDAVLAAIVRNDHILLPSGTTQLEPGDTVIGVASPQDETALRDALLGVRNARREE